MPTLTLFDNPRILIVRLSAIGDTVHSLPLAAGLRRVFPNAHLGWVVEKPAAALVENNPLLDWTKVVPKGWLKHLSLVAALRRELREQRFEIAIDVQGLTKSAVVALLSGAPVRLGFVPGESRELAPLLDTVRVAPLGRHAVDRTLSLLRAFGVDELPDAEFVLPPCPAADARAIGAFVGENNLEDGFVLMGPWGSFPAKLWPRERFLETARRILAHTGFRSAMLGHGNKERGAVAVLAAGSGGALLPAPDVSLVGVAELARRASLFVGCDSFPMHAAAAVGCPTLGLFGVTDPKRLGPYGKTGRSLFARLTLPASTRQRRALGPDNMLALEVDDVFQACMDMLRDATWKRAWK